jgi:hypothetical protein
MSNVRFRIRKRTFEPIAAAQNDFLVGSLPVFGETWLRIRHVLDLGR